jgi:hypothetical protein
MKLFFFIATFMCCKFSYSQIAEPNSTLEINGIVSAFSESGSTSGLPNVNYHLTARPWKALNILRSSYLDKVEAIVRACAKFQNSSGAIIDPYANREIQYATPYFANAVGTLLSAGRALDLVNVGIAAMNSATADIAAGAATIPDNHGEFFLAPLASAIPLYTPFVSPTQLQTWKSRMAKPVDEVLRGLTHNWRSYAMKGEWYRAKNGYVNKSTSMEWIEQSWLNTQKNRFTANSWNFYHDQYSDPLPWAYESVARSNLAAMVADGYDGASRNEMITLLKKGTQSSLLVQDPSGQAPPGGRSGSHAWNDILMANGYLIMAEIANKEGNIRLAGQYRRAAALGFESVQRWKRTDGTYSVTKNHFPPQSRVRYASYSYFTNYNGNMMYHLAENYLNHETNIEEVPAPNEIGGYTIVSSNALATAVANAGGMQMVVGLRGSSEVHYNNYWSTLGVVRFARPGWDSRLGPSDGIRETSSKLGVSFAPTFLENGSWVRLASVPDRYAAVLTTQFAHPLLVRCQVIYKPKSGKTGPTFTNSFVITPDGILSTLTSSADNFGITWPILSFDGLNEMTTSTTSHIASTSFANGTDQQNFIALHSSPTISATDATRRSSYGDLKPIRMVSGTASNITFIYPRSLDDPTSESVWKSYTGSEQDFSTLLGKVKGTVYVGRTSAGGVGSAVDIDGDGKPEATFNSTTGFLMQLAVGEIIKIETDRAVTGTIYGKTVSLQAYTPLAITNPLKLKVTDVVASSNEVGNVPENTIDQNYTARWAAKGDGQWIQYTFDAPATLKAVQIAWYNGNERQASLDIQTSADSINWKLVFNGLSSGKTTLFERYDVTLSSARYVRIVCHGNSINSWNSITEVAFLKDSGNITSNPTLALIAAKSDTIDSSKAVNAYTDVKVWPNPAKGIFNLQVSMQWLHATVAIYDFAGQLIITSEIKHTAMQLNFSNQTKGTYLMKISKNNKVFSTKIVSE